MGWHITTFDNNVDAKNKFDNNHMSVSISVGLASSPNIVYAESAICGLFSNVQYYMWVKPEFSNLFMKNYKAQPPSSVRYTRVVLLENIITMPPLYSKWDVYNK